MTEPSPHPLDSPLARQTWRVYAALTNHCNRACPWCSTCSSPAGRSWLTLEKLQAALPASGDYELQLEGGEPLLHPDFAAFVALARRQPRCRQVVVCTNGAALPRDAARLKSWLAALGRPLLIKLSFNHYLLAHDPGLPRLAAQLIELADESALKVVINVRLRRGADDDAAVVDAARQHGLLAHANVFFLQRYGFAAAEAEWDPPHLVCDRFAMVNPDGAVFSDLVARSEAMRMLP